MLRYLTWFSIAGVWYPTLFLALWGLLCAALSAIGSDGWAGRMYVLGVYLAFAFAHSFGLASLVGAALFVSRKVQVSPFRLFTAVLGALVAFVVLGRIYVNSA